MLPVGLEQQEQMVSGVVPATSFNALLGQLQASHEHELAIARAQAQQIQALRSSSSVVVDASARELSTHLELQQKHKAESIDNSTLGIMLSQPSIFVAEDDEIPGGPLIEMNMEANESEKPTLKMGALQSLHACVDAVPRLSKADTSIIYQRAEKILKRLPWLHRWVFAAAPVRDSCLAKVLSSNSFSVLVAVVIMVNTFVIALTSDFSMAGAVRQKGYHVTGKHAALAEGKLAVSESALWLSIEYVFTAFYFVELLLRIKVHGVFLLKSDDWRWILLDIVLVILSCVDMVLSLVTTAMSANFSFLRFLRAFRLAKVLRMFRALRCFQQLRLMLDCIVGCLEAFGWCLVLISFFVFLFAVVIVQGMANYLTQEDNVNQEDVLKIDDRFGGIVTTAISLLQAITGGIDWRDEYEITRLGGKHMALFYVAFICFFAIAVWNIVTSNFVEKALKLSMPDVDTLVKDKRLKDMQYAKELTQVLETRVDSNQDGVISFEEFKDFYEDPKSSHLRDFFAVRGLDLKDAHAFFEMLESVSEYDDAVDIKTFVGGCLRLQGLATSLDLQCLHFELKILLARNENQMNETHGLVTACKEELIQVNSGLQQVSTALKLEASALKSFGKRCASANSFTL